MATRELRSLGSYLSRRGQSSYYQIRWEKMLPPLLRPLVRLHTVRWVLKKAKGRALLRAIDQHIAPNRRVTLDLRNREPDVVVVSPGNMARSQEIEYVKAAKMLGIPTVIPVLSWDNLTTKGLVCIAPDMVLAWNSVHREEAVHIHDIPQERVAITGSPFFDKWFSISCPLEPRDEFLTRIGLDPAWPFIVYLGSSKNIAADETWLVQEIVRHARGSALGNLGVLVRPHPANAHIFNKLAASQVAVWPTVLSGHKASLPDSEEKFADFRASISYSAAAVGVNTSAMIDAVAADKPCIAVVTDRYRKTQVESQHFQHLMKANTLVLARDGEAVLNAVAELMAGVDRTKLERHTFANSFLRPSGTDVPAATVQADAIENLAAARLTEIQPRETRRP